MKFNLNEVLPTLSLGTACLSLVCLGALSAVLASAAPPALSFPLYASRSQEPDCPRALPVASYITATYQVSICIGQDDSWFYRGVELANPENSINLFDLRQTDEDAYLVNNGNFAYEIDPDQLTVFQNGRIIWQEPVLSWSRAEN